MWIDVFGVACNFEKHIDVAPSQGHLALHVFGGVADLASHDRPSAEVPLQKSIPLLHFYPFPP